MTVPLFRGATPEPDLLDITSSTIRASSNVSAETQKGIVSRRPTRRGASRRLAQPLLVSVSHRAKGNIRLGSSHSGAIWIGPECIAEFEQLEGPMKVTPITDGRRNPRCRRRCRSSHVPATRGDSASRRDVDPRPVRSRVRQGDTVDAIPGDIGRAVQLRTLG